MNLPLLIPKTIAAPLTSLCSLSQSKWWRGCEGSICGVILPLPCLPRTFIYLNLELDNGILTPQFKKNADGCVFTVGIFLYTQDTQVNFWSLTNISLVWTVILHSLQMFLPWYCFLYTHKTTWWFFEFLFMALFSLLSFQRELFSLYCAATVDVIIH